jgi:hypothetical protein
MDVSASYCMFLRGFTTASCYENGCYEHGTPNATKTACNLGSTTPRNGKNTPPIRSSVEGISW